MIRVTTATSPQTYTNLVQLVKEEIEEGRKVIERQKSTTYWKIGQHISRFILLNKHRAAYREGLFSRLSKDLNVGERTLQRAVKYAREFPMPTEKANLDWSHYRALLAVRDKSQRRKFETRAIHEKLSSRQLEEEIKKEKLKGKPFGYGQGAVFEDDQHKGVSLSFTRGALFTYRIITPPSVTPKGSAVIMDCGFNVWREIAAGEGQSFEEGEIVESTHDLGGIVLRKSSRTDSELYTYKAFVEKIIDGDTLWVHIDCGFKTWVREKIRLKGIDTPELSAKGGESAKNFLEETLRQVDFIIIKTYKVDKYARYLADIFYLPGEGDKEIALSRGTFLNQQMLDAGMANLWGVPQPAVL